MSLAADGQLRRSQVITTYGPGALIDLPHDAGIIGGLDFWGPEKDLTPVDEPRLVAKVEQMTGLQRLKFYSPPIAPCSHFEKGAGIKVWRFPAWFVVNDEHDREAKVLKRRIVHLDSLDRKFEFDGHKVLPIRFVRTCAKGHIDNIAWHSFVHREKCTCRGQLWLEEDGTSGDLSNLTVRCAGCDAKRVLSDAMELSVNPLESCLGSRPWLGYYGKSPKDCGLPSRLLIRTAANAYFPQVVSVLSLPDRGSILDGVVGELWEDLSTVETDDELRTYKKKGRIRARLQPYHDEEVLAAIRLRQSGSRTQKPVKQVELEVLLAQPEGFGENQPIDLDFHARRLPDRIWRKTRRTSGIERVVQLHRLREVMALVGFSRLEPITPNIHGEYEDDVERAELANEPSWFPAVENRGEGIFLQLRADAVESWLQRTRVKKRIDALIEGHRLWKEARKKHRAKEDKREHPGAAYVLLHTLSHLLLQSLSMRCGYPASSIRERIYVDGETKSYGLLLYTGTPDAEGTLGGLVQQARSIEEHLLHALQRGSLCSNDPICSQHLPGHGNLESRELLGAACHGCALIAETSCEMRNDFLDRALVVPVLGESDAAFFDLRA